MEWFIHTNIVIPQSAIESEYLLLFDIAINSMETSSDTRSPETRQHEAKTYMKRFQ
mgnify:CR=1 FL=1